MLEAAGTEGLPLRPFPRLGQVIDPGAEPVMNASIVSLLIAATPLQGDAAGVPDFQGSVAPMSLAATVAPMSLPLRTQPSEARSEARPAGQACLACRRALPLHRAPDGALLFLRGTRYPLG
jgi:hypothetical protein